MTQKIKISNFSFIKNTGRPKLSDKEKIVCFNCKFKKLHTWACTINVVSMLDYEHNQCKYFKKRDD